ncbi:MAG TPA: hypothetical protein VJR87_00725 [Allosphingosinicella sp.]|nr:hypothetical protein [Allosphingosinicella sp.]HKT13906.1 hypothetical protein [Allosphingosinicella sp.]
MTEYYSKAELISVAIQKPVASVAVRAERVFGLHPSLFVMTIGSYFAFLAILGVAFMNSNLILPYAIFIAYIVMAFGVPGLWANVRGRDAGSVQTWAQFRSEGMDIETGHVDSGSAIAQVVVLPFLIVAFAIAVAMIAALA